MRKVTIIELNNISFILFVVVSFFIAGCAKNQKINGDSDFKKMCIDSGYGWMKMKPTQDGKFIKGSEGCWGCMVEGIEHVCDKEKFMEFALPK